MPTPMFAAFTTCSSAARLNWRVPVLVMTRLLLACLAGGLISIVAHAAPASTMSGPSAELFREARWLNSRPLRPEDLQGKVVLVNFWTYTCINSTRALPYVRDWAEKYKDRGLVVIGVHTPEFEFEKDAKNVSRATTELGVGYPVVLDNDFRIWRAFSNEAWPAFYFVGPDGRVQRRMLGEGDYDKSEQVLQRLLSEATGRPVTGDIVAIAGSGSQAAADWANLRSGETYVGYDRSENFASPGGVRADRSVTYRPASRLPLNQWSLAGRWTIGKEFASLDEDSGRIAYRFHARDLHLILAPPDEGRSVRFRVTIDGAAPGADHGTDIDADGWGRLEDARMYQLVRQTGPIVDRTFEIEFFDNGVRAYDFTFG